MAKLPPLYPGGWQNSPSISGRMQALLYRNRRSAILPPAIARWQLNSPGPGGVDIDLSGNGRDANVIGSPTPVAGPNQQPATAADLMVNVDSYIPIAAGFNNLFNPFEGSMSIWINVPAPVWSDSTGRDVFVFYVDADNYWQLNKQTVAGGMRFRLRANGQNVGAAGAVTPAFVGWQHFVATWKSAAALSDTRVRLYNEGQLIQENPFADFIVGGGLTQVGIGNSIVTSAWEGAVSQAALYDVELTQEQVVQLRQRGFSR